MDKTNKKDKEFVDKTEKQTSVENETQKENSGKGEHEATKDELAEAKKEIAELKDKYLRKVAEFENCKKRTLKEKAELLLNGSEKTVTTILPVLDDFERAISDKTEDPKVLRDGMNIIFNKFVKALESIGVKKIETEGKDFNVDYHEAVAMVPGMGDEKKGKVIDCVQSGYKLNDKVIRHAKVAVGQ